MLLPLRLDNAGNDTTFKPVGLATGLQPLMLVALETTVLCQMRMEESKSLTSAGWCLQVWQVNRSAIGDKG